MRGIKTPTQTNRSDDRRHIESTGEDNPSRVLSIMFFSTNLRSYTMTTSVIKHTGDSDTYYIEAVFEGKRYLSRFDFNSKAAAWAAAFNPLNSTNYVFSAYIN